MTSDEAPLRRGGGMRYALPALPRRRLLLAGIALGSWLLTPPFIFGDMTTDSLKAKAHFDAGYQRAIHLKFEEAERELRESILLYPAHAEAHYWLACAIGNQRYQDKAMRELRKAVLLKPGYAESYYFLGLWYATRNQGEEVEGELREAIELNPNYAEALFHLADFLDRQHRPKEARPYWERALRVEKDTERFQMIWKRLAEPR